MKPYNKSTRSMIKLGQKSRKLLEAVQEEASNILLA
jgi:hypothetical protein